MPNSDGEIGSYVSEQIRRLCSYKDQVEILELNVQPDHVHLVIWLPAKYSVSSFMGYLKGKLALRLFERHEQLKRRYWGRHVWARGYCVSTIGLNEDQIRKYVKWQELRERVEERSQPHLL